MARRASPVYAPPYAGYGERDWTGSRGFDYDKFGRAELIGVYTSETPKPFRPGHFFEERADGRSDLPPTEVIVHPPTGLHGHVREHVVQRAPPPVVVPREPAPVIERRAVREAAYQPRQPMNVEIEYREHIRYPDGHVEHSRPVFDYVERERYLATHPAERAAAYSGPDPYGAPPVVVNEGPIRGGPIRRRPPPGY